LIGPSRPINPEARASSSLSNASRTRLSAFDAIATPPWSESFGKMLVPPPLMSSDDEVEANADKAEPVHQSQSAELSQSGQPSVI
jgi:hypothetical protein